MDAWIYLLDRFCIGFPKILDACKEVKLDAPIQEDRSSINEVKLTSPVPFNVRATGTSENVTDNVTDNGLFGKHTFYVSTRTIFRDLDAMNVKSRVLSSVKGGGDFGGRWVGII